MSKKNFFPLKLQTIISTAGIFIQFFAQWLISILLVRMDGYATAGIFSLAMSVSNVFAYIANYGIRGYQVTDVNNRFTDRQYFLTRSLTVTISMLLCLAYLALVDGYDRQERLVIFLYLLYNEINTMSDSMQSSLQVRDHLEMSGFSNAIRGTLCFVFFMAVFAVTKQIVPALLAMACGSALVLLFYDLPKYRAFVGVNKPTPSMDLKQSWLIIKACFMLALSQILPIITTAIPRRTIQNILGVEQLGIFSSIFTPVVILLTLIPSVVTAILPRIAMLWEQGETSKLTKSVWTGPSVLLGVGVIGCILAAICGRPILSLMYGKSILPYFPLIYWSIASVVCNGIAVYLNGILTALRRTYMIALFTGVSLLITAVTVKTLIMRYGIYGAAYVQIIAYSIQALLLLITSFYYIRGKMKTR